VDAVIADARSIDGNLEAREALEILAGLPDRQRADLTSWSPASATSRSLS
jgi:hypothetical protein